MLSFILGKALEKNFSIRYDGSPKLEYFSPSNFGCQSKRFSFYSGKWMLRGEKIYVGDISKIQKALIFFHGAGAGRNAYMREICYFAKRGFLVYCYDNTGCMESGGRYVGNLAQNIRDADAFFEYLKQDKDMGSKELSAIGHSWGGVACVHCLKEDIPVKRVISLSGIVDLRDIYIVQGKLPNWLRGAISSYLKRKYGKDALQSFDLIQQAKKPFLYVHGEEDALINSLEIYPRISQISSQNPYISTRFIKKIGHQCYWTVNGYKHFADLFGNKKFTSLNDDPSLRCNYGLLEDDPALMQVLFDFLNQ